MQTKNRFHAELWRALFDAEGVATRIVTADGPEGAGDMAPRRIFVPDSKTHVAAEIMRKI
jgi:hypothetical protein